MIEKFGPNRIVDTPIAEMGNYILKKIIQIT